MVDSTLPASAVAQNAEPGAALGYVLGTSVSSGGGTGAQWRKQLMMWARIVEVMLGCWLALSPFIFNHPTEKSAWWINDLTSGIALVTLALFSFWRPMRHAHLAIVLLGLWLISFAYLAAPYPTPPAL